jgi:uncharacterized protein
VTEVGPEDFIRAARDGVYVKLRVSPGAKSTQIRGFYGERALRISIAAPPVNGRANAEIEWYLANLLGVRRSEVAVVAGASSRDKLVFVRRVEPDVVRKGLVGLVS